MNYKQPWLAAITLSLVATVFAACADNCSFEGCRAGYCNLDKMEYLLDVACCEGLTVDRLEDLSVLEKGMLKSALENRVIEIQAAALTPQQVTALQAGRVVAGAAAVFGFVGYMYYIWKGGAKLNTSLAASERATFFDKKMKAAAASSDLSEISSYILLGNLKNYETELSEQAWSQMWTFAGFLTGSIATYVTGLGALGFTNTSLEKQAKIVQKLDNLRASLALLVV